MPDKTVVLEIARIEGIHLAGLVEQFADLLEESGARGADTDPAIRRLVPDAYADADAAREFRDLTEGDLIDRRRDDAATVLSSLAGLGTESIDDVAETETLDIVLRGDDTRAWLRTLAAIRLVLATRLGIVDDDDHDDGDPRYGIYDWLGFRLDGLVRAVESD